MWLHLTIRGAPLGRLRKEYKVPIGERIEDFNPVINTMALVATLIATVTFAAAFTMPGGYDTSPDNLGVANLAKKAALRAFILADTIAMSFSIIAVLALGLAVYFEQEMQRRICLISWALINLAMRGSLVAFMSGLFIVTAPKALWEAISWRETERVRRMDQKLYRAAKEGDVRRLSGIDGRNITEEEAKRIQDGKFLKRTQHGNNNILHIAARAGRDTFVAEALRRFPFLSDQVNSQGDTPLLVAARFGHLQVVKTLAQPNNELSMQDDDTAIAVESGTNSRSSRHQRDVEEGLLDDQLEQATSLENGTNSRDMTTALKNETNSRSSRRQRDVEEGLVHKQLEQGTIQDNVAIVENGTRSGNISRREKDVEEGLLDDQLEQATCSENETNSRDMITILENEPNSSSSWRQIGAEEVLVDLPMGAEEVLVDLPMIQCTTALHEALRNGHEEVAQYLLRLDPKMATLVNGAGESPLFLAAESRCESFMWDILNGGLYSTKGPDGLNVLHAARDCPVEIISDLIRQKPYLMRQRDDHGKAAIHYAVEAHYLDLVHQILEADHSIALFPDNEGHTPLLGAASSGHGKICEKILEMCPESIEARNHEGRHALHLCKFRDVRFLMRIPEILELLNEGDEEGNTPLHLAIKENDYGKARLLASSASIDLGAVNKEGLTALDLCQTDWKNIPQQRLMWLHLATRGAPRGRCPIEYMLPDGERVADYKPLINTMALVATLIATVTFAAAFTMPGGYDTDPDNLGVANLVKIAAIKAFIVSDTIAMSCSITAVLTLALSVNGGGEYKGEFA
ncbi:hypothetical protein RHSIM_RhsimUnG0050700 [Rhododendron simsii]|uniref:PGG domain-containing protein n=1 Tax=Rhododendron simsii TaxID=118357 RepID=A0A834FVP2_RHOSS|nr:hypothetical protein RHSIM_RhsimUnG0050700 [Rhododendron simsii]